MTEPTDLPVIVSREFTDDGWRATEYEGGLHVAMPPITDAVTEVRTWDDEAEAQTLRRLLSRRSVGVVDTPPPTAAPDESDQINALRHEFPSGGWLTNLVWNVRNNYSAWPEGTTPNETVRMIVEGFLAELAGVRRG